MKPSGFYDLTIAANASANLLVSGDYFKIMSATAAVNVKSAFGELRGLITGQGLESTPFDFLTIQNTTGAPNTVRMFVGDENFIDGMTGNVTISGTPNVAVTNTPNVAVTNTPNVAVTNTPNVAVTNITGNRKTFAFLPLTITTSAVLQLAASTRDYMLIQNRSLTGTIWFAFGIGGVTTSNGIRLEPGESWESSTAVSQAEIHMIGDIASNPNVLLVIAG